MFFSSSACRADARWLIFDIATLQQIPDKVKRIDKELSKRHRLFTFLFTIALPRFTLARRPFMNSGPGKNVYEKSILYISFFPPSFILFA